jgi:hypothetical protein
MTPPVFPAEISDFKPRRPHRGRPTANANGQSSVGTHQRPRGRPRAHSLRRRGWGRPRENPSSVPTEPLCAPGLRSFSEAVSAVDQFFFTAEPTSSLIAGLRRPRTPRSQRLVSASHFPLITPSPAQSRMPCTAENPQNPDGSRSTGRRPVIDRVGKFTEPTPPDSLPVNLTPSQGVKDRVPDGPFGFRQEFHAQTFPPTFVMGGRCDQVRGDLRRVS